MLDFNEELAKFQPCADLEEAEENIYGKELEEIKKNKTELYKANQMIKKYNQALNYAKEGNLDIRWLLKKRTNGSVRYCQYTSRFQSSRSLSITSFFAQRWMLPSMFPASTSPGQRA